MKDPDIIETQIEESGGITYSFDAEDEIELYGTINSVLEDMKERDLEKEDYTLQVSGVDEDEARDTLESLRFDLLDKKGTSPTAAFGYGAGTSLIIADFFSSKPDDLYLTGIGAGIFGLTVVGEIIHQKIVQEPAAEKFEASERLDLEVV